MIRKIYKHILDSEFIKNVLVLMGGTGLAQLIPILLSPILSRLYSPQDFGVLALYLSIFNIIQVVVTGRYDMAIILPKNNNEAINIAVLSARITLIISILSLIILYPLHNYLGIWFNNNRISTWIFLIPFSVFLAGIYKILMALLIRMKNFKTISISKVNRSVTNSSINLALGFSKLTRFGLISGQFFGDLVLTLTMGRKIRKLKNLHLDLVSKRKQKFVAHKYSDFPKFNLLQAFTDQFKESTIVMTISYFFSDAILGFYSFGLRYTKAPISLLTQSFSQVLFQKISKLKVQNTKIFIEIKKTILLIFLISILLFISIFFFIEPLFGFIFGMEWRVAGTYVKILSPYLAINFISSTFSFLPMVFEKQKQFLFIALFGNIFVVLSAIVAGILTAKITSILWAISLSWSTVSLIIIFWFVKLILTNDKLINKCIKKI